MLRKRIQELQTYRRLGLRSAGDIEKYDADLAKRVHPAIFFFCRPILIYLTSVSRRTLGRLWLKTGIPRSGSNGMDQDVNLPSRTPEDRKDPSPRPNRAVKRMVLPPVNLVRQPRKK
jgi:transcriptional adapter 2-alpha